METPACYVYTKQMNSATKSGLSSHGTTMWFELRLKIFTKIMKQTSQPINNGKTL